MRRRRRQHTQREQAYLAAALKFATNFGFKGNRLPRGVQHDATECPLGRATGMIFADFVAIPREEGPMTMIQLPREVKYFIHLFDVGRYPELVERTQSA